MAVVSRPAGSVVLAAIFRLAFIRIAGLALNAQNMRAEHPEKHNQNLAHEGPVMEKSSKRGKIPQQDWPSIIQRYEAGETLASIARTYDCSPPAISYIVSRTRARSAAGEAVADKPTPVAEPQLIKVPIVPLRTNDMAAVEGEHGGADPGETFAQPVPAADSRPTAAPPPTIGPGERGTAGDASVTVPARDPFAPREPDRGGPRLGQGPRDPHPAGNGADPPRAVGPSPAPRQDGEARRTLHLSLSSGNGNAAGGGSAPARGPGFAHPGDGFDNRPAAGPQAPSAVRSPHFAPPPRPAAAQAAPFGMPANSAGGSRSALDEASRPKEGGTFIDQALRQRIDEDIAVFLAAFDAALDHDTAESRSGLREATDRLLRAGARTRIELERLEARVPLSARDRQGQPAPYSRGR
jgi:hypothetical protein